jgi:serine/threonine protein phosphatase 1
MMNVEQYPSPEAAGATTIYAIGDIHGRLDLLRRMEDAIAQDVALTSPAKPVICYLGDYIDRGPHSAQVIDRLSARPQDDIPRVFLKGNHEDRMIEFLIDPVSNGPSWVKFGGQEALESYGVFLPEEAQPGWADVRDALKGALPPAHDAFLAALRLVFVWNRYIFVHAGLHPDAPASAQSAHDLMWIREPFLSSDRDWGYRIVHGHVIGGAPVFRANRIGIDTGAYQSGILTCLVVEDQGTRLIQVTH